MEAFQQIVIYRYSWNLQKLNNIQQLLGNPTRGINKIFMPWGKGSIILDGKILLNILLTETFNSRTLSWVL